MQREICNGIQQRIVPFSVFAYLYDLLFFGSREDEKFHPPFGEPVFLCLGRAGVCVADAVLHSGGLCERAIDRKPPGDKKGSIAVNCFCGDQSGGPLLF